jgi:hypothetical protein
MVIGRYNRIVPSRRKTMYVTFLKKRGVIYVKIELFVPIQELDTILKSDKFLQSWDIFKYRFLMKMNWNFIMFIPMSQNLENGTYIVFRLKGTIFNQFQNDYWIMQNLIRCNIPFQVICL